MATRTRYLMAGVAVIVAGSVAVDVGHGASRSDRGADLTALAEQVKTDVASCDASVGDSFAAYSEVAAGRSDERAAAEKIAGDDEPECAPVANTDLYDLATLEVPGTLRAYDLQPALGQVVAWAYPDGAAAISDIGRLLADPSDAAGRSDLLFRLGDMARRSDSADRSFAVAATSLRVHFDGFDLRAANRLTGGGL